MNYFSLCAIFCFCFCFCLCLHNSSNFTLPENKFVFNLEGDDYLEKSNIVEMGEGVSGARRLLLGGPGSSPPRCAWKCGGCMPCKPVHVPVPPGTRVTTEYYPEAWRCKCGNKLYIP